MNLSNEAASMAYTTAAVQVTGVFGIGETLFDVEKLRSVALYKARAGTCLGVFEMELEETVKQINEANA
jgi:hypothetical protein